MTAPSPSLQVWLAALSGDHARLSAVVAPLTAAEIAGPSQAGEWSIAQVLSHLGSGAEIFSLLLRAGLDGAPAPGLETFQAIWNRWNAMTPPEQRLEGLAADAMFLAQLEELDEAQRTSWQLSMFGADQDLRDLIRFRLGEHALHTWDVAAVRDPGATVAPDAAGLLVDTLGGLVARVGKPAPAPLDLRVTTHEPERHFVLTLGPDGPELQVRDDAARGDGDGELELPAEALIRLVYGRLDPKHTPAMVADGVDLELLRRTFPGF